MEHISLEERGEHHTGWDLASQTALDASAWVSCPSSFCKIPSLLLKKRRQGLLPRPSSTNWLLPLLLRACALLSRLLGLGSHLNNMILRNTSFCLLSFSVGSVWNTLTAVPHSPKDIFPECPQRHITAWGCAIRAWVWWHKASWAWWRTALDRGSQTWSILTYPAFGRAPQDVFFREIYIWDQYVHDLWSADTDHC